MRCLRITGHSFGCSGSGERLVSAARDGDLLEAKALLEFNPRLVRYSTFGLRNTPLHYSAAQGHHEIVSLLIESGVDINLRNIRGQTALMLACQFGHWEVVQTLVLFNANIHRTDHHNGGTALHLASLNGHARCIRLLLADYVPSVPDFLKFIRKSNEGHCIPGFSEITLSKIVNKKADGGITPLHMAALNGHAESVLLLLDLGASVFEVTVKDGTTIDLIGSGSTPLHYAACGGNATCCQFLIARGASLDAKNANGRTPLMVALSWHRNVLEGILSNRTEAQTEVLSSPYLSLPLNSIITIARERGWRNVEHSAPVDPCVVCLEMKCDVSAEGCGHELCTRCALYLCSTSFSLSSVSGNGPPGSIACPLCRHAIVAFLRLERSSTSNDVAAVSKMSLSLSLCSVCPAVSSEESNLIKTAQPCGPDLCGVRMPLVGASPHRIRSQRFPARKLHPVFCMGETEEMTVSLRCSRLVGRWRRRRSIPCDGGRNMGWLFSHNQLLAINAGS